MSLLPAGPAKTNSIGMRSLHVRTLCTAAAAAILSIVVSTSEDLVHILWIIPVLGLTLYTGLISGYIPSPLYRKGEIWPRQYAIFQFAFILLTAFRLSGKYENANADNDNEADDLDSSDDEEYEYQNDFSELTQFTNWMGANLHSFIFKEDGLENLIEVVGEAVIWFIGSILLSYFVDNSSFKTLRKFDETKYLSSVLVFTRNLVLLFTINIFFIYADLFDDEGTMHKYCLREHSTTPGLIAPSYPISMLATEFAEAWKVFHPSYLTLVRLSHSILYPSILLLLTRRRLTHFFIWLMFIEIDFFHMLADMFHYVSGPELAEERLNFQGHSTDCYVNVVFWQTMLAYPLNFLYLTTSLGDTMNIGGDGMVADAFHNSTGMTEEF
eukprot:910955_1